MCCIQHSFGGISNSQHLSDPLHDAIVKKYGSLMVHKVDLDSQPQLLSRLSCLVHDDVATRHCLSPFMLCREGILVAGRTSLDGLCVCLKQHCYSLQLSLYLLSYPPPGFDPFTDSQCYEICGSTPYLQLQVGTVIHDIFGRLDLGPRSTSNP